MELLGLLSVALSHLKFVLSHDKVEGISINGVRKEIKTLQNYKHYLKLNGSCKCQKSHFLCCLIKITSM